MKNRTCRTWSFLMTRMSSFDSFLRLWSSLSTSSSQSLQRSISYDKTVLLLLSYKISQPFENIRVYAPVSYYRMNMQLLIVTIWKTQFCLIRVQIHFPATEFYTISFSFIHNPSVECQIGRERLVSKFKALNHYCQPILHGSLSVPRMPNVMSSLKWSTYEVHKPILRTS